MTKTCNNNMRIIASISSLLILSACGHHSPAPAAGADTPASDTVPVFILKQDTLKKTAEFPAELVPYENAELFAKVQGFVKEMKVDMGDRVKKGQVLAVIEAPEVNSRLAESEAAVQAAKAKWTSSKDQYERLYRASQANTPGIVAPVDLERSRNQMQADSATFVAAGRQAQSYKAVSGYLYIIAPFDGVVTARKADPGSLVGTNAMLLTVQNNNVLRLRAAVPEIYVATADKLQHIDFRVDAYPTERFKAVLTRKSETIDPNTRTELWEFKVDNSDHRLKAGAFCYVKVPLERNTPSFVVPFAAVATTQEKKFVIRVKDGKAEWVDVRPGMTVDAGVEIFGNIAAGDTLLSKATDERKPGSTGLWTIKK
ncbi:efflux RND transporter periplasmic adaptor subunit [Chitinophaga varians]|uniref:Efflux RND transporter periplasmic adaptor subunit n=1 Tax=Chitinophaga varians TaxID=2202339 RepID=A0A847S633_9BACT|nr:efflux RND transporter periplasmic adaptor subunit [Chitinophaga varians]NLR68865.1 efflux RND transporter periplasmic adaptor subunit [Chitinophaga varians]